MYELYDAVTYNRSIFLWDSFTNTKFRVTTTLQWHTHNVSILRPTGAPPVDPFGLNNCDFQWEVVRVTSKTHSWDLMRQRTKWQCTLYKRRDWHSNNSGMKRQRKLALEIERNCSWHLQWNFAKPWIHFYIETWATWRTLKRVLASCPVAAPKLKRPTKPKRFCQFFVC